MWKFCIYVFSALFIPLLEGKTDLAKIHAATKLKKCPIFHTDSPP